MLSTKDLSGLPDIGCLKNFCKGLAALDIIMLEEEWSFIRHYSYNPVWRKGKRHSLPPMAVIKACLLCLRLKAV